MLTKDEIKKLAAVRALGYVKPGMTIGIGTGSTVYWFIVALAARVKEGLACTCVPTSAATAALAAQLAIPLEVLNEVEKIEVTIDGADEIDPQLNLIKGGGAALLQEKMVAAVSERLVIVADSTKLVERLGAFPLPVEVIPYGWKPVQRKIENEYQVRTALREKDGVALITDHGHYILDCHFGSIVNPVALAASLHDIPGVVDCGLFNNLATEAIIAYPDGRIETMLK